MIQFFISFKAPKSRQNLHLQNLKKCSSKLYHIENSKAREKTVDPDEVSKSEAPHLDLQCLQIQQFLLSPLALMETYLLQLQFSVCV